MTFSIPPNYIRISQEEYDFILAESLKEPVFKPILAASLRNSIWTYEELS